MGYNTRYSLTTNSDQETFELISARAAEISDYSDPFEDTIKWYDHDTDMLKLSLEFPGVLMTLNGEGEEAGDIWVKYYLDGKMQEEQAKIVLGDFDPSKLK